MQKKCPGWNLPTGITLVTTATKVLQFVTPDRKPGWGDLQVDLAGILAAAGAVMIFTQSRLLLPKAATNPAPGLE